MKTTAIAGVLMLVTVAPFTAEPPGQSQASTTKSSGTAPQDPAKQSSAARKRKIPCKTPQNASLCYWTRGRLSVYNGGPPNLRIWKVGTKRILGVFSGPSHFPPRTIADNEDAELPRELYRAYEANNRAQMKATGIMWALPPAAFADFEVCPLEPEHKGWMQNVCIECARNIFIEKDY